MTLTMVMPETSPLAHVKSKFSEMVDRVEHTHDRIVVTRNGPPAAVMISPDELASLEDTLDLLSDPVAVRELAEAREAHESGDYVTGDEHHAVIGLRIDHRSGSLSGPGQRRELISSGAQSGHRGG